MGLYTLPFYMLDLCADIVGRLGLQFMGHRVNASVLGRRGFFFLSMMTAGSAFVSLVKFLDENIEMYYGRRP